MKSDTYAGEYPINDQKEKFDTETAMHNSEEVSGFLFCKKKKLVHCATCGSLREVFPNVGRYANVKK